MNTNNSAHSSAGNRATSGLPPEILQGAKEIAKKLAPLLKALEAY